MSDALRTQVSRVRGELHSRPEGLVRHVERVLVEALDLGARYDIDPLRTELATWGHDLFRAAPASEQANLARAAGVAVREEDLVQPVLLHGPTAAAVLASRFEVTDEEVLAAVREHSVGGAEMPMLGKVILLADKFEKAKRRRDPLLGEIRRLARRDLDMALLCWADWKWVVESERGWYTHPDHWGARIAWVTEHHAEIAQADRIAPHREDGPAAIERSVPSGPQV